MFLVKNKIRFSTFLGRKFSCFLKKFIIFTNLLQITNLKIKCKICLNHFYKFFFSQHFEKFPNNMIFKLFFIT